MRPPPTRRRGTGPWTRYESGSTGGPRRPAHGARPRVRPGAAMAALSVRRPPARLQAHRCPSSPSSNTPRWSWRSSSWTTLRSTPMSAAGETRASASTGRRISDPRARVRAGNASRSYSEGTISAMAGDRLRASRERYLLDVVRTTSLEGLRVEGDGMEAEYFAGGRYQTHVPMVYESRVKT